MNDKLQTLIAYYEEEKQRLLQLMDDYVKEWECQLAHFHARALFRVNGKLQILYSLQDRNYSRKAWREEYVKRLEDELNSEIKQYSKEFLLKRIQKEREILDKLNQVKDPVNEPLNGGAFSEALNSLLEGEIKSFILFLSQEDKLHFDFTYKVKTMRVVLSSIKRHLKTEILSEENLLVLQDVGFRYNTNKSRLVLYLAGNKEEIKYGLRWRLAKIVFELFHFQDLAGKSCIAIKEKAGR